MSKFKGLYESIEYLQEVLNKKGGVKWEIADGADVDRIKHILSSRGIVYDID
jgi:hypothetical protein